jgi:hypothetical protein
MASGGRLTLELVACCFPQVTRIDDAGHYLQEDAHERIVPELLDFVSTP